MMRSVKPCLRVVKWAFSVVGISLGLYISLLILFNGCVLFEEPNTPILIVETCLFAFGLILQFIPLKD